MFRASGSRCWRDQAQLAERGEDDPRRRSKIGLGHLDHGGVVLVQPQHSAAGAGRCIFDGLGQLDQIEFGSRNRRVMVPTQSR